MDRILILRDCDLIHCNWCIYPKFLTSLFLNILVLKFESIHPITSKAAGWVTNSVDPVQIRSVATVWGCNVCSALYIRHFMCYTIIKSLVRQLNAINKKLRKITLHAHQFRYWNSIFVVCTRKIQALSESFLGPDRITGIPGYDFAVTYGIGLFIMYVAYFSNMCIINEIYLL